MNKQLLVDYLPFEISPAQITESMKENNGKLVVRGVLQRAEAKNQNGRVYPREILQREAKKYTKEFISQRRAMGELDHPESSVVNLNNVSHNIAEVFWRGDDLCGRVEVLDTPSGSVVVFLTKSLTLCASKSPSSSSKLLATNVMTSGFSCPCGDIPVGWIGLLLFNRIITSSLSSLSLN